MSNIINDYVRKHFDELDDSYKNYLVRKEKEYNEDEFIVFAGMICDGRPDVEIKFDEYIRKNV